MYYVGMDLGRGTTLRLWRWWRRERYQGYLNPTFDSAADLMAGLQVLLENRELKIARYLNGGW